MSKKSNAFTINTLNQAENIILHSKIYKIKPTLHFKNYILKGFGSDFVLTIQNILKSKFGKNSFKIFVDCGFDSSLVIKMASNEIDFIKLKGNSNTLKKIKNITNKNRVLLNPAFNIVDCRNLKNINLKLKKLYFEDNI